MGNGQHYRNRIRRQKSSQFITQTVKITVLDFDDPYEDFVQIIPLSLEEDFTAREFAAAAHIRRDLAQITLHILHHMKLVDRIGKRGREYLYSVPL